MSTAATEQGQTGAGLHLYVRPSEVHYGRVATAAAGGIVLFALLGLVLPRFYVHLVAVALIFGLFALAFNLLMGFAGLVSFGHAAFFGLGGYAYALFLVHTGIQPLLAMILAPFVAALAGLVVGAFCVRLHGILFAMLTLAFGQIIWAIVQGWYDFTGGDDGIVGIPRLPVLSTVQGTYTLTVVIVGVSVALLYILVKSPFGQALNASRQNRDRIAALGVNVTTHRLAAFVISSFFTGVAGMLLAQLDRSVFPVFLYWTTGAEALIMSLLGGVPTFTGPLVGAFMITGLRFWVGTFTLYLPLILGVLLIIAVLFFQDGLVGALREGWARTRTSAGDPGPSPRSRSEPEPEGASDTGETPRP